MAQYSSMDYKAVKSAAKGDSGRERLQLRKGKITPQILEVIMKTLGLGEKEVSLLHITDVSDSLIMLHPREMEASEKLPLYIRIQRGVIIDTVRETIVAHGGIIGTSSIATDVIRSKGHVIVKPNLTPEQNPKVLACTFERYIPHVNLRVFRWAGKTYISSYNTIDTVANNSRWGDHGIPFAELLKTCGLSDPDSLFPEGCMYSPYVHTFDVCHPSLNVCSFNKSSPSGFIVSRRMRKAWHTENDYLRGYGKPIGTHPTDEEIGVSDPGFKGPYGKKIESPLDGPGFYDPKIDTHDSLDGVSKFLSEGYYDVPGPYGTGESVIVTFFDYYGNDDTHHFMSPPFNRRMTCMWKNDYNIYRSCILHYSTAPLAFNDKKMFMVAWPPYVLATPELLEEAKSLDVPPICIAHRKGLPDEKDIKKLQSGVNPVEYMASVGKAASLRNLGDALNIVHSNLVYTASPYYLDIVYRSKARFAVDVRDLIAFIQGMGMKIPVDFPADKNTNGPRATISKILENARISAEISISKGQNTYVAKNGSLRHYTNKELIDYYIASNVPKLEGGVLYRLIRVFRLHDHTSSLLITEPEARPRAIIEGEKQQMEEDFPSLAVKEEEISIAEGKSEEKVEINDDIYGPAAPSCSWASVASKPGSWADEPVTAFPSSWAEMSESITPPVTPPTKKKEEPLPSWLSSSVSTPSQIKLPSPARGRGTPSTRGSGLRGRGLSSISSSSSSSSSVLPSWLSSNFSSDASSSSIAEKEEVGDEF